jgi:MFS family permease
MPLRPCRRSYEVEENKRLVLDEVEDTGLTPGLTGLTRARGRRARRRNAWDRRVVAATPVFYGWVVAALAALSALIVSPAQVFCVGVVVDAIVKDTQPMTRLDVTRAYAVAGLISAPLITLYPAVLLRLPRRVFLLGCGIGVCVGLLLLSFATGALTLTLSWTLLQALGPGMLYPCADSALHDWWRRRR